MDTGHRLVQGMEQAHLKCFFISLDGPIIVFVK